MAAEPYPTTRWDCARLGHRWTDSRRGLTPLKCLHCPSTAVICPDCRGWSRHPTEDEHGCQLCQNHGVLEVCQVTRADLAYLMLTAKRYRFLLHAYADAHDGDTAAAVRELDVMMAAAGLGDPG
jgi:hypothetical protein